MNVASRPSIVMFALAAGVAGLLMSASSGRASDAEATRLCQGDAMQFCLSEIPNRDRITACMIRNKTRLSPACQTVFNTQTRPGKVETASTLR